MHATKPRQTVAHRHALGKAHLAQVLGWWLAQSDLSYAQLSALASWATGEPGILVTSQITHLRKARLANVNWRIIEALACANLLIWRWHTQGPESCFQARGPFGSSILSHELMDHAIWLRDPEDDGPLDFAGWCELFAGRITLDYIGTDLKITERETILLGQELSALLNHELATLGMSPRDAMAAFIAAYPVDDPHRRARLTGYILGSVALSRDELQEELAAIAAAIATIRKVPATDYGPLELYAEATRNRKRT